MKRNKDFKIYGVDLEKEYNNTKSNLISLEAKIIKRVLFLQKQSPKTLIWNKPISNYKYLERYRSKDLLYIIQIIEKEYINQSKQIEIFKTNKNEKD